MYTCQSINLVDSRHNYCTTLLETKISFSWLNFLEKKPRFAKVRLCNNNDKLIHYTVRPEKFLVFEFALCSWSVKQSFLKTKDKLFSLDIKWHNILTAFHVELERDVKKLFVYCLENLSFATEKGLNPNVNKVFKCSMLPFCLYYYMN